MKKFKTFKTFRKKLEIIDNILIKKYVILFHFFFLVIIYYSISDYSKFYDILPYAKNINKKSKILNEIFKSRKLFINDSNITLEYIQYVRKKIKLYYNNYSNDSLNTNIKFDENFFPIRKDQLNFTEFGKLCVEEKLIDSNKIKPSNNPQISIIVPAFNRRHSIKKSIRSIQNQSLKNIEIIIVDDCSTDNSMEVYNELLDDDPRIRLFIHLKNMGLWRARISGFLYSRGKYIIPFDSDDLYSDNYVLEDLYNLIEKYNLDSVKMLYRLIFDYNNLTSNALPFDINYNYTEIVYKENIGKDNWEKLNWGFGLIWNRLTRSDLYTKGLSLLSSRVLNIYKNFCEDQWWNRIIDITSNNMLIVKRFGYLYFQDKNGSGKIRTGTESQRDKMIQEFITFLYFDYELLPKEDSKKYIIRKLYKYDKRNKRIVLNGFKSNFYILDNLLNILIQDPYVSKEDKEYVNKLLTDSLKRQGKMQ